MDTRSTAPLSTSLKFQTQVSSLSSHKVHRAAQPTAPRGLSPRTEEAKNDRDGTGVIHLLLRFFAQPLVDVRELSAVFDAVVGQGEGFFFLAGLKI